MRPSDRQLLEENELFEFIRDRHPQGVKTMCSGLDLSYGCVRRRLTRLQTSEKFRAVGKARVEPYKGRWCTSLQNTSITDSNHQKSAAQARGSAERECDDVFKVHVDTPEQLTEILDRRARERDRIAGKQAEIEERLEEDGSSSPVRHRDGPATDAQLWRIRRDSNSLGIRPKPVVTNEEANQEIKRLIRRKQGPMAA